MSLRTFFRKSLVLVSMIALSACAQTGMQDFEFPTSDDIFGSGGGSGKPVATHPSQPDIPVSDNIIDKNKKYKVALFLPVRSGSAPIKQVAISLLNAARLAHQELNEPRMELVVYPTDGTVNTVVPAAQRAATDKIDLIIGPLLAPSVVAAREYTEPAGIPMLALSNDQTAVNGGFSYLLSFLPEQNVANVVNYAVSQGHSNFGFMSTETPYGKRVHAAFTQEVGVRKSKITNSVFYTENSSSFYSKAQEIAETDIRLSPQTPTSWSTLMFADNAAAVGKVVPLLKRNHINFKNTLILGTGVWSDPSIFAVPELQGAVFASPDPNKVAVFEYRYQNMFKQKPIPIASLSYDAVALAVGLIRQHPNNPFDIAHITNPNGFTGVNGIFRFRNDGLSERGLSVMRVNGKKFDVIVPAPETFAGS